MKITFLGTGTSHGIPMIGCDCPVCTSVDPRNFRRRCSLFVETSESAFVIDTPPDFREQVLTFGVHRVDFVLITHAHADHIFGFDDLRRFSQMQQGAIPVYASSPTVQELKNRFAYVLPEPQRGLNVPLITFHQLTGPRTVRDILVEPISVPHGPMPCDGFILQAEGKRVGYIPDCGALPDEALARLTDLDVMILDGLRHRPHPTHLTVEQCVDYLQQIGAPQSFLTHISHELDHETAETELPENISIAYDGLRLER